MPYYNEELEYFRKVAPEFARKHPTLAGRLRMSEAEIDDPHVERLIQACAFLNARTRRKIDDDFSEISQALLQVLYPHYVAPFPSAAIVRFAACLQDQAELVQGFSIQPGSNLETDPIDGDPCRFRTRYPVTVWPIEVTRAGVQMVSFPIRPYVEGACSLRHQAGVRHLRTRRYRSGHWSVEQLRFFLNAPARGGVSALREHLQQLAGRRSFRANRKEHRHSSSNVIAYDQVGFERTEALVPTSAEVPAGVPVADRVLRLSPEVPVLRRDRLGSRV